MRPVETCSCGATLSLVDAPTSACKAMALAFRDTHAPCRRRDEVTIEYRDPVRVDGRRRVGGFAVGDRVKAAVAEGLEPIGTVTELDLDDGSVRVRWGDTGAGLWWDPTALVHQEG